MDNIHRLTRALISINSVQRIAINCNRILQWNDC